MDAFWEIVASNAVVATILAIVATLMGRIWRNAAAVHLLWVVVLLKLFTPPLITTELPFALELARPAPGRRIGSDATHALERDEAGPTAPVADVVPRSAIAQPPGGARSAIPVNGDRPAAMPWSLSAILAAIWMFGALGCTAASYAVRIRRFAGVIREFRDGAAGHPHDGRPAFAAGWG